MPFLTNESSYEMNKVRIPNGSIPLWTVSDDEYKNIMFGNNIQIPSYPIFAFTPSEIWDGYTMRGKIGKLETNGSFLDKVLETKHYYLETYPGVYSFFQNYYEHKDVYFTFDHLSLWKLEHVFQTKPLEITLRKALL